MKPPQQMSRPASEGQTKTDEPTVLIAFKDDTIQAASAVWADRLMLHYRTRQGAHEQVRLDRVDWKLSEELNRRRSESPVRPGTAQLVSDDGR
jgi:hypothetical protein